MKLIKTTHYSEEDPDCIMDYCSIDLRHENGDLIVEYGDYYHDKGYEKMEGFIAGMRYMGASIQLEEVDVADAKY